MKKATTFAGVSALVGLVLILVFCYYPVLANQQIQDAPDKPQIAMVIDVSNSMSTFLFPSELPGDLKLIQDRIDEIEGMEEYPAHRRAQGDRRGSRCCPGPRSS